VTQCVGAVWTSAGAVVNVAATLPFVLGAVNSGQIGSGQVGTYHFMSGATPTGAMYLPILYSGINGIVTAEIVSGVRAVAYNQSGQLVVAMAAVSGRMPAVGVAFDNVLSGIQVNVYALGLMQYASLAFSGNFSGFIRQPIWVGRSGHLTQLSGSWASGGFLSGDIGQKLGFVHNSGAVLVNVNTTAWSGGPIGEATGGVI